MHNLARQVNLPTQYLLNRSMLSRQKYLNQMPLPYFIDPKIPISKVPCHGCGSLLQCADTTLPGYLPSELMRNRHRSILAVKRAI